MKFSVAAASILLVYVSSVTANFDIYEGGLVVPGGGEALTGYYIFEAEPDCDEVFAAPLYIGQEDVSGDKEGVRCEDEGSGCVGTEDPVGVTILEMNFHSSDPVYHWTMYKDRNYDMYGLDGNVYGQCILFPGDDFGCPRGLENRGGNRKFRCLTEFTAAQINSAAS